MHPAEDAYRRYRTRIYSYLFARTGSHHDAEDLTQRVFLDALNALSNTETAPDSVLHWLYAVAQRRLADEYRRRSRAGKAIQPAERAPTYNTETARAITAALQKLTAEQRSVVVLRLLRGLTFPEIADSLGTTEDACKMRFSRALTAMQGELRSTGFDELLG